MRRILAFMLCVWSLGNVLAQRPLGEAARKQALERVVGDGVVTLEEPATPEIPCPFDQPRLTSAEPREVAWAAHQLTRSRTGETVEVLPLVAALRTMRELHTEEHQRAVLHVLHAALVLDLVIPSSELRFELEGRARIPWLALQARATTKNGREVFERFQELSAATDPGWEVLGDSLAVRNHAAFALELRTRMVPRLIVFAGRPVARIEVGPQVREILPATLGGWPPPPIHSWQRDRTGLLRVASTFARRIHDDFGDLDERSADRARLRWLAELAGEPQPTAWALRFEAQYRARSMEKFAAFAQASEVRARESLERADLALRKAFRVSDRLQFPGLEVSWQDGRSAADQAAMPMPARR